MAETLARLGAGVTVAPMEASAFVKPHSIYYELDGVPTLCSSPCFQPTAIPLASSLFLIHCPPAAAACPAAATPPAPAGKPRRWDMVASHPSVAVLLYHRQRGAVILVRQVGSCGTAVCPAG